MPLNDDLYEAGIGRAHHLERFKNGLDARVLRFLRQDLHPDILGRVQSTLGSLSLRGRATTRGARYLEMLARIREMALEGYGALGRRLQGEDLVPLAKAEAGWQVGSMGRFAPPVLSFAAPDLRSLSSLVSGEHAQGLLLRDHFKKLATDLHGSMVRELNIGLAQGDGIPALTQRLHGRFKIGRTQARNVARTLANHAATMARQATFEENASLLRGVRFVATLDFRTTYICASLDGQVYAVTDGPRPPMHHQCRSTTVPVVKSWRELGFNARDLSEGQRQSLNGLVPDRLTYEDWFLRQPAAAQRDYLGDFRYGQFLRGRRISSFVNNASRIINIDDLRAA